MSEQGLSKVTSASNVYVDSNVFVYLFEGPPEFFASVMSFFEQTSKAGTRLMTSEFTLAECIYKPSREDDFALVAKYEALLEPGDEIEVISLDGALAKRAALAGGKQGLKLADAIHYVSAIECGCQFFATADTRVRSSPGLEVLNIRPQ